MAELTPRTAFVTPEAVVLSVDAAGLGSRMIAVIIDGLIQGAVLIAVFVVLALTGTGTAAQVVALVLAFLAIWAYFPVFEGLWGATPGKRAQHLRVVQVDGQPATLGPVLVRNLIRIVDFLPGGYAIGVICILLTPRSQRLGDLAAGTLVMRIRSAPEPSPLRLDPAGGLSHVAAALDVTAVTEREYELVRSFLERRAALSPEARVALGSQLATTLRPKVATHDPLHDEVLLEALALAYRQRFAGPSS